MLFLCESLLNDANRVNTCYSMLFNAYLRYSMLFYAILARESMLIARRGTAADKSSLPLLVYAIPRRIIAKRC